MCKEGIALGKSMEKDSWIINKTFVSNSMIKPYQNQTKKDMITTINLEILAHLFNENQDENFLQNKNDLLKELMPL